MKLKYIVFITFSTSVLLILSTMSISYTFASEINRETDSFNLTLSNKSNQTDPTNSNNVTSLSSSLLNNTGKSKGTLVVKVISDNQGLGKNKSSDFLVSMHANEPVPSIFEGSTNGTEVELSMGMYSVTISSIPNYNSTFSEDCYGGIMNIETKICYITNTYFIPSSTSR